MRARLLVVLGLCVTFAAMAQPPPVTAFTNFAQFETATVSPRGTYLALTRNAPEGEVLTIVKLSDLSVASQNWFGRLTDIERVEWANDERLLIQPTRRFPGLTAYKVPTGEIFGLDYNGTNLDVLFGYAAGQQQAGTRLRVRESIDAPARLLTTLTEDDGSVLIQSYGYGIEGDFNHAYRMDVDSGLLTRVANSPIRDGTFFTDLGQRVAFVYGEDHEGNAVTYYRPPEGDWQLVAKADDRGGTMVPVGPWNDAGEFLVLDNRDAPTAGVFLYSPRDGGSKLLFRNPTVDVVDWRTDPRGKPWMFLYDDHFRGYWYPDAEHPLARVHQWLTETLQGHTVDILSTTSDMSHVVARVSSPRAPLVFFYVDAANRKLLQQLTAYRDLPAESLAAVDPIEFKARDGLTVRGLLTVPNLPEQKLPLIVLVHGGPHGVYDVRGFDYEAQLFASRGYAVLQINYRGSGGRGRDFEAAGYGKWGAEMQDDVTDGVRWAIGDGVADPERICIYGTSYGAYAALTGAFREPDLFRCAVGMAGVYDLPLMFERGDIQTVDSGVNYLRMALGTNIAELERRSPVFHAERIRAAVMLLHGEEDVRAPLEHAKRMRKALEKAGNPPEWITEWGEGHGLNNEVNRAQAYQRILAFFAKHLAPETLAPASPGGP
jgi:dipeptidyl aminopeptidase/acylaminoacyl peptidase